jgi:UDP-N-acetylmuramoyl-L-alanyl-D-glutamate--2,6-diaminopimelate ligase
MAGLAREGVTHAIFEASSHGLQQHRTEGVKVSIAAFTNLSRDHLDYHGDMDSYFAAKMRLLCEVVDPDGTAVIWADDEWSDRAIQYAKKRDLRIITVGANGNGIQILKRSPTQLGQTLELRIQGEDLKLNLPLIGAYQAANALTAAAIVLASGGQIDDIMLNLGKLQPVRGRLERAAITRSGAPAYVDYAHTPDGLDAAIAALRPHTKGRLITVFGAGGDRDKGKRPEMGRVAGNNSDIVIVTDDNPRGEDPAQIRREILADLPNAIEIGDRRSAIARAVELAGPKDIILVAGKGHEQGQIIGSGEDLRVIAFDDVEVVRECAA